MSYLYPTGGQRGTTVTIGVNGTELAGLTGFYTTGSGLTGSIKRGKDASACTMEIAIASDAPLGIQQVRVYDATGMSNPRYFCVGAYPEMLEKEPNDSLKDCPKVTLPITVNGRIEKESDRDGVTFHASVGQTVVCEVQALRILGHIGDSWLKGFMEICDARGNVLASSDGTSDDYYRWDPLIAFESTQDGDYTVFYRDLNWRGDQMAVYRLTLGVVPHAIGIFPLGGQRGKTAAILFSGPNLKEATQQISLPKDAPDQIDVTYTGSQGSTNARPFQICDLPDVVQTGTNHTLKQAQSVPFSCVVNGRLAAAGVRDYYKFHIEKKQKVALETYSRRLGTPMDSELQLYNSKGEIIQNDDDGRGRDSRIEAELEPGDYTIRVRDMEDRGGAAFAYRLFLAETQPRLRVRALPDAPKLVRGGTTVLSIHIDREDGLEGDVIISADKLPPGITATSLTLAKDKQDGQITMTATPQALLGPLHLTILGTCKAGGHVLSVRARTEETYNIQGTAYQRDLLGPILLLIEK